MSLLLVQRVLHVVLFVLAAELAVHLRKDGQSGPGSKGLAVAGVLLRRGSSQIRGLLLRVVRQWKGIGKRSSVAVWELKHAAAAAAFVVVTAAFVVAVFAVVIAETATAVAAFAVAVSAAVAVAAFVVATCAASGEAIAASAAAAFAVAVEPSAAAIGAFAVALRNAALLGCHAA